MVKASMQRDQNEHERYRVYLEAPECLYTIDAQLLFMGK